MSGLEFTNSRLYGFEGFDSSTWQDRLARLPEVYESLTSLNVGGISISPPRMEEESEEEGEPSPPGSLAQSTLLPSPPILGTCFDLPTEGTQVVKVPDKNPPCPCCGNRTGKMSGLIEHLKRVHGRKKVLFQCAKCGKTNVKHHSIACHYPKCKGIETSAPVEGWTCEECGRTFDTKIGLGQHKRFAHPVVRNIERIAASRPEECSARGVHRQCWTEEEVELLQRLDKQCEGSKNINKLIAEHIPSKTAKQISDKRRGLHKSPVKRRKKDQEKRKYLENEELHLMDIESRSERGLRSHYRKVVSDWITSDKLTVLRGIFEKVIEGEKDLPTLIDEATKDRCACLFFKSHELNAAQGGRPKATQRVSPSEPPKMWMKKRAKRRGQFLRFQQLFYLDRGKIAGIILDDVESL